MPFVSSVRGNFGLAKRPFPLSDGKISNTSTGGSITTAGGYRIHTFTSTGADTFTAVISSFAGGNGSVRSNGTANTGGGGTAAYVELLMIAGGGGGGSIGGGGGAGGYIYGLTAVSSGANPINVGGGGSSSPPGHSANIVGTQGGNSTGFGLTAIGGGFGCGWASWIGNSGAGGSSGGGTGPSAASAALQPSQPAVAGITQVGHKGEDGGGLTDNPGMNYNPAYQGGGGGGAGGAGFGRPGGIGLASSITGTSVSRAGGGGGGCHSNVPGNSASNTFGTGGEPFGGGRGAGENQTQAGSANPNTGSGGGGAYHTTDLPSGAGGSGIIVVRYIP